MAEQGFEQLLEKLEELVRKLETGDLSLEASLEAFKDGVDLIRRGNAQLTEMEGKVELLMKDLGGDRAVPFEPDDGDDEDSIPF